MDCSNQRKLIVLVHLMNLKKEKSRRKRHYNRQPHNPENASYHGINEVMIHLVKQRMSFIQIIANTDHVTKTQSRTIMQNVNATMTLCLELGGKSLQKSCKVREVYRRYQRNHLLCLSQYEEEGGKIFIQSEGKKK